MKLLEIGVMRWVRVLIILPVIFVMLFSGIMYVNYQTAVESHLRMWNARASIICQYINDGIDSGLISEATPTLYGEWGRQNNGNEYIVLYQNELPSDVFFHGSEKGNRDAYWCARLQENGSIEVWYSTQLLSETQLCVYTVKDQKAMVSFQINFTEGWINTSNLIGYYCNVDKTYDKSDEATLVATGIKSIDPMCTTYRTAGGFRGVLNRYARDLLKGKDIVKYKGIDYEMLGRQLQLAFPDVPLTEVQKEVLNQFVKDCKDQYGVDILITVVTN